MTLEKLYQLTVEGSQFRFSRTRATIMGHLWTVAGSLCRWGIECELWIDGSFLTEKIDPPDVDFLVLLPEGFSDNATNEQAAIIEWLCQEKEQRAKELLLCDAYDLVRIAPQDHGHQQYLDMDAYWRKQFGVSRQGIAKGMALVSVPGGCV